jgi:hypothetical protein
MVSTSLRFSPIKWRDNTHIFDPSSPDGIPNANQQFNQSFPNRQSRTAKSVHHTTDLTVFQVAGTRKDKPFGFDHYVVPVEDKFEKIKQFGMTKYEPKCFTDKAANDLKWVPGAQYVPHRDWNKTNFKDKGKFGKYKKITFTEEVLKE